jgi:DNA-binding transcriptional regulator YdaS (Cro superfamily)
MNAIQLACQQCGTPAALAAAIGVKAPTVYQWLKGTRPVPVERVTAIELATQRRVRRWHLRPGDWHLIWPELVGTAGAPEPPIAEARAGAVQGAPVAEPPQETTHA